MRLESTDFEKETAITREIGRQHKLSISHRNSSADRCDAFPVHSNRSCRDSRQDLHHTLARGSSSASIPKPQTREPACHTSDNNLAHSESRRHRILQLCPLVWPCGDCLLLSGSSDVQATDRSNDQQRKAEAHRVRKAWSKQG